MKIRALVVADLLCELERLHRGARLRGAESQLMTAQNAAQLAATFPRGRAEEIPGAYHYLMLDQPAHFVDSVVGFAKDSIDAT